MSKRTTNSSRLNCAPPLAIESLESRQLLSAIPLSSHALPTARLRPTGNVALNQVMGHQELEPVLIVHQAPGATEIMSGESLSGMNHSSEATTDLTSPNGKAVSEGMALTHQAAASLSHGTALATNQMISSEKNGESLREIGSAARAVHLPSFQGSRRARARHAKGVSTAQPRSSNSAAETRRTRKGRAIAQASLWFEVADVLQASAKAAEAAPTTEARPSGCEQRPEGDVVPESLLAQQTLLTADAAEIASLIGPEQAAAMGRDSEITPAASDGSILAGWLPIDLPALERKVDAFFSQIEKLGEEATDVLISSRLTPWLVIGTITVGVSYALARRHLKVPALEGVRTGSDPRSREWTWLSNGAVLPPREKV